MKKILIVILVGSLLYGCGVKNNENQHATFIANRWHQVSTDEYGNILSMGKTGYSMDDANLLLDFHVMQRNACFEGLDSVMTWLTLDMESSSKLERKLAVGAIKCWTSDEVLEYQFLVLEKLSDGEESQPLVDKIKKFVELSKKDLPTDNESNDLSVYTCIELSKQYYTDLQKLVDGGVYQWNTNSVIAMAKFVATDEIAKYDKVMIDEIDKLLPKDENIDVFSVYNTINKWSSIYKEKVSKSRYAEFLK